MKITLKQLKSIVGEAVEPRDPRLDAASINVRISGQLSQVRTTLRNVLAQVQIDEHKDDEDADVASYDVARHVEVALDEVRQALTTLYNRNK